MQPSTRRRLGEILVAEDVLLDAQLEDALAANFANPNRERLGQTVVRLGLCSEQDIVNALSHQLRHPTVDLSEEQPQSHALDLVPEPLATRHLIVPLEVQENGTLVLAMADPTDVVAIDDIRLATGISTIDVRVATTSAVATCLHRVYGNGHRDAAEAVEQLRAGDVVEIDDAPFDDVSDLSAAANDQPIVRVVNALLADAVKARASDLHIEPTRNDVQVRYRIDGLLREAMSLPRSVAPAVASRIKIMAQMDIAERRLPQDGRAMIRVGHQEVDLRISTMPTMHGETLVVRVLRKGEQRLTIEQLGMDDEVRTAFEHAIDQPQGLVVITGPTGSGKTTSLYGGLQKLADPVRNILTLEDPIEYQLDGINQTQINTKIGLSFARGLRTVLRQDPDVVMVGEIRDRETADLCMEASMTGHLVLSTLHTNDAPATVARLADLGVERFLIGSSLLLVVAQRLVRTNCGHCSTSVEPDPKTVRMLGIHPRAIAQGDFREGSGCVQCDGSGFQGRVGVYEVLQMTPKMRDLITAGGSESAIHRLARAEGMRTLRDNAIGKATHGITTLEEALRVTPEESIDVQRCHQCNYLVGDEFVVCPSCSAPIESSGCESCGNHLDPDWAVCPYCRAPTGVRPRTLSSLTTPRIVLVIDDDPSVLAFLRTALQGDYEVIEAGTGEAALQALESQRVSAVLMDRRLPDIDGVRLTEHIRELPDLAHLPVIMITGVDDPTSEVEGLIAGVTDYLTKPFDPDVLLARLNTAIRRSKSAA